MDMIDEWGMKAGKNIIATFVSNSPMIRSNPLVTPLI
jgi:hypothetical protein